MSVGIWQFRRELAAFINAGAPVEVTRQGRVIGTFWPTRRPRSVDVDDPGVRNFDPTALLAAGAQLQADMAARGIDSEELIHEADEMHRRRRGRHQEA
ncbi:MAG: hypothetical protein FWF75_08860 [Propionibacteriaceae bacterium]|nr:hypothetical protein [Propionibacteriaceae bacterium]